MELPIKNIPVTEDDDDWLEKGLFVIETTTLVVIVIFVLKRAPLIWHVID